MTDIEADGVGPETLALRKELGSGSDVTGVQDGGSGLWIQCWVNILYSPWFPETLALRKELGSGSDVTGSARWWIRLMMKVKCQILAPELELALVTLKLMVSAQGDDTIQFQDYSEARVISKVMVEFQATETLALRKELGSGSDVTGSARWWIRLMMKVKCQILAPELELALVVRPRTQC
ncbi:hypothetical protein MUG91_G790n1 [Manis pentadactyla]|nr:hypothetical protein MUG91_G790n1 [Manis pentadactyla]